MIPEVPLPTVDTLGEFVINGRFRVQPLTGVQRYAHEIVARLPVSNVMLPRGSGKGAIGHLWEQTALPILCKGRLLWNPNASGPMTYGRQVVTFHDLFPVEFPEWYSSAYARWYGIVMRTLATKAMHLIAVSEYTKSRLVNLFGRDPEDITVIHNGCHVQGPATPEKVAHAMAALKIPGRRYVLSLSSMERRKNTAAILQAWGAIYDQLPSDTWLVLAGPEVDKSIYGKQLANATPPRVFYTGYVPEEHLTALYTGASLFVFPSFAEGFGFPLLEAMACGVRSITSRTSSLPEVGGDVVDYIDPSNSTELACLMRRRLREAAPRPEPFEPSICRARTFSWETAATRTHHVLKEALVAMTSKPMLPRPVHP